KGTLSTHDASNLSLTHTGLLSCTQIFQSILARVDLIFTQNQGEADTKLAGGLKRLLELKALIPCDDDDALSAQVARQLRAVHIHARAQWSDVNIGGLRFYATRFLQGHHKAVFTN